MARKLGPPKGSMNRTITGVCLTKMRLRLVIGELPARFRAAVKQSRSYRRVLQQGVAASKRIDPGDLDTEELHLIDMATGCTAEESVIRKLLREGDGKLSAQQTCQMLRQIRDAKRDRLAAIRALKSSALPAVPWIAAESAPA